MKLLLASLLGAVVVDAAEWQKGSAIAFPFVGLDVCMQSPQQGIVIEQVNGGATPRIERTDDGGETWRALPVGSNPINLGCAQGESSAMSYGIRPFGHTAPQYADESFEWFDESKVSGGMTLKKHCKTGFHSTRYIASPPAPTQRSVGKVMLTTHGGYPEGQSPYQPMHSDAQGNWIIPIRHMMHIDTGISVVDVEKVENGDYSHLQSKLAPRVVFDLERLQHSVEPKEAEYFWGKIMKTTDGGDTWTEVFSHVGDYYLNDIVCPSENICIAVGEGSGGRYILRSSDGGDTWMETHKSLGVAMRLECLSETHCMVGGGRFDLDRKFIGGSVLETLDSGRTWHEMETDFDREFVMGIDAKNGAAVVKRWGADRTYFAKLVGNDAPAADKKCQQNDNGLIGLIKGAWCQLFR
ncbi:MAG: hypothetical protein MHM6MM_005481 [Cercozoa sp. M6MM]